MNLEAFWFGSEYSRVCSSSAIDKINCQTDKPNSPGSIISKIFGRNDAVTLALDRRLNLEYKAPKGNISVDTYIPHVYIVGEDIKEDG